MKKGFTIVELLAVITLLGILSLISVPLIETTITKNKDKLYKSQINTIREGAKIWAIHNNKILPKENGETLNVNLEILKSSGFVESKIKNPKNDKCFYNNMNIIIKRISNNYEYVVDDKSGIASENDCGFDKNLKNEPIILMYGQKSINLKQNEFFNDPGVTLTNYSKSNGDLLVTTIKNENGVIIEEIDTIFSLGKFTIEYYLQYKDKNNITHKTKKSIRNITVSENDNNFVTNGTIPELDSQV